MAINWPLEVDLGELADELGSTTSGGHFPPGTSKWNKIEHRLFCHISQQLAGAALLTSREVVVNLIGSVTTDQGLRVKAALDENAYEPGIKVSDADLAAVNLTRDQFHGEWNYRITPRVTAKRG